MGFTSGNFYKGGFYMFVLFATSILYICFGISGLFGKMIIPKKFKGHEWTKDYVKRTGVSYLLLGFPWLILCFAFSQYDFGYDRSILFIVLLALPSLAYSIYNEEKYKKLLKKD